MYILDYSCSRQSLWGRRERGKKESYRSIEESQVESRRSAKHERRRRVQSPGKPGQQTMAAVINQSSAQPNGQRQISRSETWAFVLTKPELLRGDPAVHAQAVGDVRKG